MSFHLKSVGPIETVKADVEKCVYMPSGLKSDILAILVKPGINAARVLAYGHGDEKGYELGKCEVEVFSIEQPAPVAAPVVAAPVDAAPPA